MGPSCLIPKPRKEADTPAWPHPRTYCRQFAVMLYGVVNAPIKIERHTSRLKALMARKQAALMPGTPNALFARVIEDLGYQAVYITGAGIANMSLGVPDVGLVTLTELADHVAQI